MENPEELEMTEGQENFYKAKREHVQRCLASGDIDTIAKVCEFILNHSEKMLKANEELKRKLAERTMRYEEIVRKVNAEKNEAKKKRVSILRGPEIVLLRHRQVGREQDPRRPSA